MRSQRTRGTTPSFRLVVLLFSLACSGVHAWPTYNMDVVWTTQVSNELFFTYGEQLCGGDFDGTGFSGLAVSGDSWIDPMHVQPKVYLFLGGPAGLDSIPDAVILHDTAEGGVTSLAAVDVNEDGFSDLVVGDWKGYPEYCGSVRIYLGGRSSGDTITDFGCPARLTHSA